MSSPRLVAHAALLLALFAAAAIALAGAVAILRPAPIQVTVSPPAPPASDEAGAPHGFTVSGTATLEAVPDTAELSATLAVDHVSPREASTRAQAREQAAQAALTAAGVPPDAVSLSRLRLAPEYDAKTGKLRSYQAAVTLTVTTKDFALLPTLLQILGEAGATSMSTAFKVTDLPALKKQVRQLAGIAAKEKAAELAAVIGFELGAVQSVVESPGDAWSWGGVYSNAVVTETAPSVAHGDLQSISLTITVTYCLPD